MKHRNILFSALLVLTGCSSMKPEDFSQASPKLDLFQYFEGRTQAWGLFEDRFGTVKRQFSVDITGTVDGDILTLDEQFEYNDGEKDRRVWTIQKMADGTYQGQAADVDGIANGRSEGNALYWTYIMNLKVGDSTYRVRFDDWMFLQKGNVLINRARVSKWGFDVGEVSLFFTKPAGAS